VKDFPLIISFLRFAKNGCQEQIIAAKRTLVPIGIHASMRIQDMRN
jgi:hypothetical protein